LLSWATDNTPLISMGLHKLRALEYLIAVVEHGSFAAAARALGVSSPSVHRSVSALERQLAVPLLHRDDDSIRATQQGHLYVTRAKQLLGELRTLDDSLADRAASPSGTLVVAAQSVASQSVLAPMLPSFIASFPNLRIDLLEAGSIRNLAALECDILLQFGWPPAQEAVVRTLAHTRWLVVAAPSFWARTGVPRHPVELAELPCALFRTPYGEVTEQWRFDRGAESVDVAVNGPLIGSDRHALDMPVLSGQLAARWNDLTVARYIRSGRLQPVLLDWEGRHSPPLNLLIRKSMIRQPRIRAFVDFISAYVAAMTADRVPNGLPPVAPSSKPDWFRRRVR
jgi:DNA-binding transcriptional LysR family regulator